MCGRAWAGSIRHACVRVCVPSGHAHRDPPPLPSKHMPAVYQSTTVHPSPNPCPACLHLLPPAPTHLPKPSPHPLSPPPLPTPSPLLPTTTTARRRPPAPCPPGGASGASPATRTDCAAPTGPPSAATGCCRRCAATSSSDGSPRWSTRWGRGGTGAGEGAAVFTVAVKEGQRPETQCGRRCEVAWLRHRTCDQPTKHGNAGFPLRLWLAFT